MLRLGYNCFLLQENVNLKEEKLLPKCCGVLRSDNGRVQINIRGEVSPVLLCPLKISTSFCLLSPGATHPVTMSHARIGEFSKILYI